MKLTTSLTSSYLAILVTLSLAVLLFQIDSVNSTELNEEKGYNQIEPIYLSKQDRLEPGNNNNNNNKNNIKQSSPTNSFSPKKLNSNKEFLFGDEEEDDDEKPIVEVASSDTNMLNSQPLAETEMTNQNENNNNNNDDSSTESIAKTNQKYEETYDDTDGSEDLNNDDEDVDEDDEELMRELKRSQRIDSHKQLPALLNVNKMAELQRKLAELSEKTNKPDYDLLLNDDSFEQENNNKNNNNKKLKNIAKENPFKNFKNFKSIQSNLMDNEDEDEDEVEDEDNQSIDQPQIKNNKDDTITVEELLVQLENKLKNTKTAKFMKPTLEIKEEFYLENKTPATAEQNNLNSFFNQDNEAALNNAFEMTGEREQALNNDLNLDMILNQTNPRPVSDTPSLKQKSDHTHSGLDSFETIKRQNDYLFLFVVAGCTLAGVLALLAASVCWYTVAKSSKTSKSQAEFETKNSVFHHSGHSSGSVKSNSSGDKKLALSAQMYHYQHQKEQMIAMEKANNDTKPDNSDNSDDETPEGDYTVYECPGLAPTGEMEVKNPLFKEDSNHSLNKIQPPPSYSTLTLTTTTVVNETVPPAAEAHTSSSQSATEGTNKQQ